ncbi:hypothetical protein [Geomicrobium sp. JCM 19038]|uniref:hypothetical protein n=1 Tax=Geomicrobium sp. JCM 19038 TaxID=1460635 RepID=UPI00045F3E24|nr:hypothetical protein [Geomicrobium sp. JCM 19038]GAK07381.1 hypothetical protein JCM19038_1114 [Geomicrobium sp. JCM 19038]
MDQHILTLSGESKFTITIDPTVWIFDNRKLDVDQHFNDQSEQDKPEEPEFGPRRWQTNQIRTKKEALIEGSYGMVLKPFIENAEPTDQAKTLVAIRRNGEEYSAPIDVAKEWIAVFSENGQVIKTSGPLHIYYGDGSNRENPITDVVGLRLDA